MTPQQMKEEILRLAKPLDDFMREQGIASFHLGDATETNYATIDISATRIPLPPHIKCVLWRYGCIYVIVGAGIENEPK